VARSTRVSQRAIWRVSVLTTSEAADAVTDLLGNLLEEPASSYTNVDTGSALVSAYLRTKPADFLKKRDILRVRLDRVAACGLSVGPGRITLTRIPRRDWAEAWKRHFKPIEIGTKLLLRPSWSNRRPRKGQALVLLDPGLSFGTGQHPTTRFCLQQTVIRRDARKPQAFLDLGTGSGILALAAARVGYDPVDALDCDPEAVRVARANARLNGLSNRVHFSLNDVARLPERSARRYSIICANLLSDLLLIHRRRFLARMAPDGLLVLAGVLEREFAEVQSTYEAAGLRLVASQTTGEWRSGAFAWKHGGG